MRNYAIFNVCRNGIWAQQAARKACYSINPQTQSLKKIMGRHIQMLQSKVKPDILKRYPPEPVYVCEALYNRDYLIIHLSGTDLVIVVTNEVKVIEARKPTPVAYTRKNNNQPTLF